MKMFLEAQVYNVTHRNRLLNHQYFPFQHLFERKYMVGKTGFEPATPWSQAKYSTKLSYFPIFCCGVPKTYAGYAATIFFTFEREVACPERFELPTF